MKVVYIVNEFPKISETFILNEVIQVQKNGLNVEVVAFSEAKEDRVHPDVSRVEKISYFMHRRRFRAVVDHLYWFAQNPARYLRTFGLALNRANGISRLFLFNLHNVRLVEKAKPDHIHAHFGTWTADMAMLVGLLTGIPFTFTTHSYDIFTFPPRNMALKSRLAKKHITVSLYNKKFLVEKFKVRPEDIEVVHCGVDLSKIPAGKRTAPVSNKMVTMARLAKTKGLDYLIKVYDRLKERGCRFEAIIIGDGPERESLEKLITDLNLDDCVRLLGNRTQNTIFEILLTCKLMVMTSLVEGIPVSLMEAMAFRIPVIATRITGIPELVDDGESGFLIEPADMDGLIEKIERVLSDEALRARFTERGYQKVVNEFNLEKEIKKLIALWKA
jgi:colanic acid/amylovoran biosynthesis glycosyltransferase